MQLFKSVLLITSLSLPLASFAEDFSTVYKAYQEAVAQKVPEKTLELAIQAAEIGLNTFGADSENGVNLQYNLAKAYAENKKYKKAFETMSVVVEGYTNLYGDNSKETFSVVIDQLSFHNRNSTHMPDDQKLRFKTAVDKAIDIAEALIKANPENATPVHFALSKTLARVPLSYVFYKKAKRYTELAYEGLLKDVGEKDYRTLQTQFSLANLYYVKRKYTRATELFEGVVSIASETLDTSHPFELAARSRLVNIYETKGKSEKSTEHCIAIGKMKPWEENIDPQPLFRLQPTYPKKAMRDSRNGWAKMSFTISEMGFVEDVKILESKGGKGFEKESLEALKKWRYAPKIVDGKAVAATGKTVQLDFKISK